MPLVSKSLEAQNEKAEDHRTYLADGVIQAPGGPNEDGDYSYGGWTAPYRDPAAGRAVLAGHSEPFDLLLGRRTYDIWSGFWPKARAVRSRTA
jgi:hypothetical protein